MLNKLLAKLLPTRFTPKQSLEDYLSHFFGHNPQWIHAKDQVKLLTNLVVLIRPKKKNEKATIDGLIYIFSKNPKIASEFKNFLLFLFKDKNSKTILTDAGILEDTHFFKEVKRRAISKILPYQPHRSSLEYLLNQVFYAANDPKWINEIPLEKLIDLFNILDLNNSTSSINTTSSHDQIVESLEILLRRVNGRVQEADVLKMVPEYQIHENPFISLLSNFEELLKSSSSTNQNQQFLDELTIKQFKVIHKQCEEFIKKAFHNSTKYGISLKVNQHLLKIRQQLERINTLTNILTINKGQDKSVNTIQFAQFLITNNCKKNDLRQLIDESTQLISYEITQHSAKTGEHYITETKTEYIDMFISAMGGGVIVGIMCIVKVLLGKVDVSDFGHAFLYSANYAIGFTLIYLLGFTLATKQPAMTAAKFIQELKKGMHYGGKEKYDEFSKMFAKLFRSQFIAFVGNVFLAFPIALLGVWLLDVVFGYSLVTPHKAEKLITDINPIHSLALFHAAIAGIFLFISGIISGSIANRDKHLQIPYRIKEHPLLKLSFGQKRTTQFANFYEKKWPGIVSNCWFGVFMGSTSSIGVFLGLNLDIRHITFASGNFSLGLYGDDFNTNFTFIFWAIIGIGVIGLVNFLISFTLSLLLAFRSRKIKFIEIRLVFNSIWSYFKNHPIEFLYPPKEVKKT